MSLYSDKPDPQPGEVWRERRREYQRRTVRVLGIDDIGIDGGFVHIETITTTSGEPPERPTRTRVRGQSWHSTFTRDGMS